MDHFLQYRAWPTDRQEIELFATVWILQNGEPVLAQYRTLDIPPALIADALSRGATPHTHGRK